MQSSNWGIHRCVYKSTKGKGNNINPRNAHSKIDDFLIIFSFYLLVEIKLLRNLHEDVRIEMQLCHE